MIGGGNRPTGMFSLPPDQVTTGQLYILLQQIRAEQVRLREDFERDRKDKDEMVAAWKAGGTVLKFIRLAGYIAMSLAAVWAFTKGFLPGRQQ